VWYYGDDNVVITVVYDCVFILYIIDNNFYMIDNIS
jgi:hypothetical protein